MQSLFALHQCKEASYELCLENIADSFAPDLNSMEVQDKTLLTQQNVEHIYDHFISALSLLVAFAELAEIDKKVSHKNFLSNQWIKALRNSEPLRKEALRLGRHWQDHTEKVRLWFRDVVRQDNEYLNYLDRKNPSPDDQRKFVSHLFKKVIFGKTVINDFYEEDVLRWTEDKEIVKALVEKAVKSYDPETSPQITLPTLSLNWEEDKDFIERLFKTAISLPEKHKELIANNTRNWEVERLPLTDRIILEMAIAELITFPNIPVKVTINEYIELAKNYSTPKSRQFINGILDVIANELKGSGEIKKSGRGLIDNK
jgi:N utilization substance protein B